MAIVLRREWWGRAGFGAFGGAGSDRLGLNEGLGDGQCIISTDGRFATCVSGGNWYIHKHADPGLAIVKVIAGGGGHALFLMPDGHIKFWKSPGYGQLWMSGGTGNRLIMQNDGNLVLYDAANVARWASGTDRTSAPYPQAAAPAPAPAAAAPSPPPAAPAGPDPAIRQRLADRFNSARQRALAASDSYTKAVAQANRAIQAAKRKGAPDAIAFANQAAALAPQVHDKAQASIEAANAYGKQQGFAGLRGFEGYAWAYGDLADDAGTRADEAARLLAQIQSIADQAELADASYSPPAAGPAPTTPVPEQIAAEQVAPPPPPAPVSTPAPSVSVSVSSGGEATVSSEPPITKVLLYGGLAALGLFLLKGGKSNG